MSKNSSLIKICRPGKISFVAWEFHAPILFFFFHGLLNIYINILQHCMMVCSAHFVSGEFCCRTEYFYHTLNFLVNGVGAKSTNPFHPDYILAYQKDAGRVQAVTNLSEQTKRALRRRSGVISMKSSKRAKVSGNEGNQLHNTSSIDLVRPR